MPTEPSPGGEALQSQHLATYLNDHLAGATAGLELFEHLAAAHENSPMGGLLRGVKREVEADRTELEAIIARLGEGERPLRKAAGWFSERLLRLKLRIDDPADGALRVFESLEALLLGLEGKSALWRALGAVSAEVPALHGVDIDRLIDRGRQQRDALELVRIEAAKAAFGASSG